LLRFHGADVAHVDRLTSLAGRADRGTWWAPFSDIVPDWLKTFVGLEGLATAEFVYRPLLLHGLNDGPLKFTAVVEEVVLDRQVGGSEVMRAQLAHLLTLAELSR
jgi:hypothetical protein